MYVFFDVFVPMYTCACWDAHLVVASMDQHVWVCRASWGFQRPTRERDKNDMIRDDTLCMYNILWMVAKS